MPKPTHRGSGRVIAALLVTMCAGLVAGCSRTTTPALRGVSDPHGTYAGMQAAADKYARVEVEQLTTGYFGAPLHATEGAHVGSPVPIHAVRLDADLSHSLVSRLEPFVDSYTVPVLNAKGEILGEYLLSYHVNRDSGAGGWRLTEVDRKGWLVRDLNAKARMGMSPDTSTTLVASGADWSVAVSGGVERGVATRVIFDHNSYAMLPVEGRVYEGRALRAWFTPKARGW